MTKILLILFIGCTSMAYGQKAKGPNFDIASFNQNLAVAEWLYQYDLVAWRTSDSVMVQDQKDLARLGSDWFCFQQNDTWHAIYGKYQDG